MVVRVHGELDLATVGSLRQEIDRVFTAPSRRLVLDCRGLTFVDSTGAELMLALHRQVGGDGTRFAVAPGAGAVRTLLELTGLAEHFTLVDDDSDELLDAGG